jgi:hypothetical protein
MPAKKKNKKKKAEKSEKEDDLDDLVAEVKQLGVYEGLKVSDTPKLQPAASKDDNLIKVINSNQKQWAFYIANIPGDGIGRRAVANQALQPGFTLVRETGFPWIVQCEHERKACHFCTAEIGTGALCCVTCERAFYCSEACQTNALPVHRIECKCLASKYEAETGVDPDLMRVGLAYLVRRKQPSPPPSASTGVEFESCEADMLNMIFHSDGLSASDREACLRGAQALRNGLPLEYHVSDTHITDFFCRVNTNSHGLSYTTGPPDRQFGLGLFPLCAIFNHSCYPNVVFLNEGNRLVFRVIRPVQKGEELTVNYVGLYQGRRQRRQELWVSKRFVCNCRRCSLTPNSMEEAEHFFNDKFLDGICCRGKKDCKGIYQPTALAATVDVDEKSVSPPSATNATGTSTSTNPVPATLTTTTTTSSTTTTVTSAPTSPLTTSTTTSATAATAATTVVNSVPPAGDMWRCGECGHSVSYNTVLAPIEKEVFNGTARAIAEFEEGKDNPSHRRDLLEGILRRYAGVVAPQFSSFFNLYLGLANVCAAQNDQRARLDYIRLVLKYSELVFPKYFLPSASFYRVLADCIDKTIVERNEKGLNNKAILGKYFIERREALATHYQIISVCCGPNSARAKEAKAWFERSTKTN